MKRVLSIILSFIMLLSVVAVPLSCGEMVYAQGEDEYLEETEDQNEDIDEEEVLTESSTYYCLNPIYGGSGYEEVEDSGIATFVLGKYLTDKAELATALRNAMAARETSVTLYYYQTGKYTVSDFADTFDTALAITSNPYEGDYLRFHYHDYTVSISRTSRDGGTSWYHTIAVSINYLSNADQEAAVTSTVSTVLSQLGISSTMSDYNKVKAIYDYICKNVTYDYTHLNDDTYLLKHSAYAALINKTSVCQGYANLFYYMAKKAGLDVRIVSGTSNGEHHAWNIVKLGDYYYYIDTTWDAGRSSYSYFLKGSNNFANHTLDAQYTTTAFKTAYPMATADYAVDKLAVKSIWMNNPGVQVSSGGQIKVYMKVESSNGLGSISLRMKSQNNSSATVAATATASNQISTDVYELTFNITKDMQAGKWVVGWYKVTDKLGKSVSSSSVDSSSAYFTIVSATAKTFPFTDVKTSDWYYESVKYVYNNNLMNGLSSTTFSPQTSLTRAQFATIIYRIEGQPKVTYTNRFTDIPRGTWYTESVLWAEANGIVTGYPNKIFKPMSDITREQMALMMYRYAKYYGLNVSKRANLNSYKDGYKVSDWAKDAMSWAVGTGLITGKGANNLDPQGFATRAECATIMMRFVKNNNLAN